MSLSGSVALAASAASVEPGQGEVSINRGSGFQRMAAGAQVNTGDLLMVGAGGNARLVYTDGCKVPIIPGRVVRVGSQSPCTAKYGFDDKALGATAPKPGMNPVVASAIVGAIGFGIYCAAVYCQDDGGGGRRITFKLTPASP